MRYLMMICTDEAAEAEVSREEMAGVVQEYVRLTEEMERKDVRRDSARLRPTGDATTVRVRDGELRVTDGPFAETKEQIGGYYVLDVPDLDEAIAWARRFPSARVGSIEIRPIWEPEDYETA